MRRGGDVFAKLFGLPERQGHTLVQVVGLPGLADDGRRWVGPLSDRLKRIGWNIQGLHRC